MTQGILGTDIRRPVDQICQIFPADKFSAKQLSKTVQAFFDSYNRPGRQQAGYLVLGFRYPAKASIDFQKNNFAALSVGDGREKAYPLPAALRN